MRTWLPLLFGIAIYVLLHLAAKSNTRLGEKLRASDHAAWQDAVEDRENELAELRKVEPQR